MSTNVVRRHAGLSARFARRCRWPVAAILLACAASACGSGAVPAAKPTASDRTAPEPGTTTPSAVPSCPPGLVVAQVYPPDRRKVRLRIINGSGRAGIEDSVAAEFRGHGVQVVDTVHQPRRYGGVVTLRYGPPAVGAAWTTMAFFLIGSGVGPGQWKDDFQITRTQDVVDVILGEEFNQLATITEVNQATAKLPFPTPPPGTCAAPHV
jgi:hypothetical protein